MRGTDGDLLIQIKDVKVSYMTNTNDNLTKKINQLQKQSNSNYKRKPSKWQLYLRECIPGKSKDMGMGAKVSACSVKYKDIKAKNPKYLDELVKLAANNKPIEKKG